MFANEITQSASFRLNNVTSLSYYRSRCQKRLRPLEYNAPLFH